MRHLNALLLLLASPATAQSQLAGVWECVMNMPYASIQALVQIYPNGQLQAQGYRIGGVDGQFHGGGQWIVAPPSAEAPNGLIRMQIVPANNMPVFPLFLQPTEDPDILYNYFVSPQGNGASETSCRRAG